MVYVDDMYTIPLGEFNGMKMSHMVADTQKELILMAKKIGVQTKWIQYQGTNKEHFDIAMSKRELAVKAGAVEVGMRELAEATLKRKTNNDKIVLPLK